MTTDGQLKMLTKTDVLGAEDITTRVVEVPEWGGSLTLRMMTGADRDEWENAAAQRRRGEGKSASIDLRGLKVSLLSRCVVDEEGAYMFSAPDLVALNKKAARALERLWEAATEMNGIGDDTIEEMEKNLESGQSDNSGSDSPDSSVAEQ